MLSYPLVMLLLINKAIILLLVHSRKFDRNQFRVLFAWFDFIHRCFFHSRWSCQNQEVMAALDLHIQFIPLRSMIIGYSMLSLFVPNPTSSFFGHWFRIQSSIDSLPSFYHNTDWFSWHDPILCVIDIKNENMVFMRNRRSKLSQSSLIQWSK